VGRGWDEGKFAEQRLLTAADLDAATTDHPVVLTNTTGHYSAVNSAALSLAKITRETPDPPAGTIDRAADGTPTGVLKESAQALVGDLIPPLTQEQEAEGIRAFSRELAAEGMTGFKDPGLSADLRDLSETCGRGRAPAACVRPLQRRQHPGGSKRTHRRASRHHEAVCRDREQPCDCGRREIVLRRLRWCAHGMDA
jgi:predicted amidohydrolase YtcJ